MNNTMNVESRPRTLTTADLAASANRPERLVGEVDPLREDVEREDVEAGAPVEKPRGEKKRDADLAPLFDAGMAGDFRNHWNVVQQGFVDNPQNAVREGDELVAQVIKSLAETFAKQRAAFEGDKGSTEDLRLALRRYRSFFERLLSI